MVAIVSADFMVAIVVAVVVTVAVDGVVVGEEAVGVEAERVLQEFVGGPARRQEGARRNSEHPAGTHPQANHGQQRF